MESILAVDIGGTKTAVAAVSSSGEIFARVEEATCQQGPEEGLVQVERLLRAAASLTPSPFDRVRCIGISIPAVLEDETDRVLWVPKTMGWRELNLRDKLQKKLGIPVYIEYDGHAAVLGEWWVGAGRGCRSIVDVIIGTGVGGGMILDGKLYRGANRLAGAAGWFALTTDAGLQDERIHSRGHWEAIAAGPGFELRAKTGLSSHPESRLWSAAKDREIRCADIFAAAQSGDPYAIELASSLADWLGLGIANIISLVNPERVILGGGVGSHAGFLVEHIQEVVRRWAQPVSARTAQIAVSQLGKDAGLLGAAYGALLRLQAPKSTPCQAG